MILQLPWLVTTILFFNTLISSGLSYSYSSMVVSSRRRGANNKLLRLSNNFQEDENEIATNCPFSQKFPRYRIDLTRNSRKKKEDPPPFFIQQLNTWINNSQKEKKRLEFESRHPTSRIVWLEDQDGIQAMASLWKEVVQQQNNDDDVIVALPDCDGTVVLNWKELLDWIQDNKYNDSSFVFETTILEEEVNAVRIKCFSKGYNNIEDDDETDTTIIIQRTKAWVKRLLVNLSICPFTKSVTKSGQGLSEYGVPVGKIAYHVSRSTTIYELLADTWMAIHEMIEAGPGPDKKGISSILLAAPHFDGDFDLWSGPIFSLLEQTVVAAQAEPQVGVVCFHPLYATPDGTTWPGFGQMHSVRRLQRFIQQVDKKESEYSSSDIAAGGAWQRRTPHATINVLRADQLALAESQRNTPKLYTRNIKVLLDIGNDQLSDNLEQEQNMGK